MLVGGNVLFFPSRAFRSSDLDQAVRTGVTRYVNYLRVTSSRGESRAPKAQAADLARRFMDMRLQVGRNLGELYQPLKQLRRDVSQLAATVPSWPDFAWNWDEDLQLMGMLMGLVAGPAGRRDLPAHLEFPPPDLARLVSKQQFYEYVLQFLLALNPADLQRPGADAWFQLARECVFAQFIVLHGFFGLRFLLQKNFKLEEEKGPGAKVSVTFALPAVLQSVFGAPELLLDIGLDLDKKYPVQCKHGTDEGPVPPRDKCEECIRENHKDVAVSADDIKASELIKELLVMFARSPQAALEIVQPRFEADNVPDAVFWLVGARGKSKSPTLEVLKGMAADAKAKLLVPERLLFESLSA